MSFKRYELLKLPGNLGPKAEHTSRHLKTVSELTYAAGQVLVAECRIFGCCEGLLSRCGVRAKLLQFTWDLSSWTRD